MPDLSVIIITYNTEQYISSCLESVISQLSGKRNYEVVIVDNASEDSTREVIQKGFPNLTLIRNSVNKGFAFAVNQGVQSSQGKHILLLNPDAVLEKNFLGQLLRFINENPKAAIVGCKFEDRTGHVQPSCWKTPTIYTTLIESFFPYRLSLKIVTDQPHDVREVDMVSGGCMLIERSVYEQLHGFDERFFMYYEDMDFCLRAREKGYKVFYYPEAKVIHRLVKDSWRDVKSFFVQIYTSKLYFFRKHHSRLYYLVVFTIVLIGILIRIIVYLLVGVMTMDNRFLELSKTHLLILPKILRAF